MNTIWTVLIGSIVGQVVVGTIFMIGFVAVVRRSIDKDIPARLLSIDGHIEKLGLELLQMRREVDRHGYKIEALELLESRRASGEIQRRDNDLDDTGVRNRTRGEIRKTYADLGDASSWIPPLLSPHNRSNNRSTFLCRRLLFHQST